MSRILSIFAILMFLTTSAVYAQYPIPSWQVTVHEKATFQEQQANACEMPLAKRTLHVHVSCVGSIADNCSATVWVYSLDGSDMLGPFTVNGGETIDVEIDDREWGTLVQSDSPVNVDVWIDGASLNMLRR